MHVMAAVVSDLLRFALALLLDAVVTLVLVPTALLVAAFAGPSLTVCRNVGAGGEPVTGVECEGPMLFSILVLAPLTYLIFVGVYIGLSIRRGRSPGMVVVRLPSSRTLPPSGGRP